MHKSHIFSLDVIRVVAILGVVVIHIANAVYTRPDFFGGWAWWITIIMDSLSRVSIPFFILISGFLILRKDESFGDSLKRIFFRIVIPLLFWLIFYMWYGGGFPSITFVNASIFPALFFADVFHLYYLVIVLGLYFVAPMIRAFLQKTSANSQNLFMWLLIIFGVVQVGLQYIFHACAPENIFIKWVPYIGLFVAGYVMTASIIKVPKFKLVFGYLIGLLITIGFNYFNAHLLLLKNSVMAPPGCLSHYTDYYLSINVFVMSLCLFLLLFGLDYQMLQKQKWLNHLIQSVARASFGIYLIHPFVARFLEVQFRLAIDFVKLPLLVTIFIRLVLVFGISYGVTVIARKIPLLKLVFGEK